MQYTIQEIKKRNNLTNKIKSIFNLILYIIFVPLIIYNIFLIVQSVVNPKETPQFFGIKTYVIISRKYGTEP